MQKKYIAALTVVIALALLLIYLGYDSVLNTQSTSAQVTRTSTKVKDFTTTDLQGNSYKFSSSKKITVYEGFAEWCLPCRKSVPEALKFAENNESIEVIGIAYRDVDFKTKEFLEQYGEFELTIKSNAQLEKALGLKAIPQTLFVVDGVVRYRVYGSATAEDLEKVLLLVKSELSGSKKR